MGLLQKLNENLKSFIEDQKVFFVSTTAPNARINLSPKGLDSFRVLNDNTVAWMNLTGSGNETAAHLLVDKRMTIMFCAFEGAPLILRLYGTAKTIHEYDENYAKYEKLFPKDSGNRQVILMEIESVQTSCGFGVPEMEFKNERRTLNDWAEKKGRKGIIDYWTQENQQSIDGLETKIFDEK